MWMRVFPHLRQGARYGSLFVIVLALGMGFVIFVGSSMGDCPPGRGCHDHDGAVIGRGLLLAVPIVLLFGAGASLLLSVVHGLVAKRLSPAALKIVLVVLTLALMWISFNPAFDLYFRFAAQ